MFTMLLMPLSWTDSAIFKTLKFLDADGSNLT